MMQLDKPGKRDAKTKIIRFLTDQDPQPLTSEDETILKRWEDCDRLLRAKEADAVIIDHLVKTHGVSSTTAYNDIFSAMEVFGKSRRLNKNYLLHHHLQRIDRMIEKINSKWFDPENPKYHPSEKEIAAVARLNDAYTYAVNSLPAQSDKPALPPPIMVFSGLKGMTVATEMSVEDAIKYADDIIAGKLTDTDERND